MIDLCKIGLHRWSQWSKPLAGKRTLWGFEETVQARTCSRCKLHEIRQV